MNDTIGKIVERESAILPGYDNCSIHADHRNMTRFTGRADEGYGQVRGVLQRWARSYEESGLNAAEAENVSTGNVPTESVPTENIPTRNAPTRDVPTADGSVRGGSTYHGPVFNGPISGRYVIPGVQTTGGTVNFNFPG